MSTTPKHALIVGASSGTGRAMAHEMVTKLTLCARSCPPDLLSSIKAKNPDVEVVFERLDMSLLHDVRKFTSKHATTKFDWVVLTAAMLYFRERNQTSEGLDDKLATMYYARFMLLHDMLSNLNRPGVRVLCVLAAGQANIAPDLDDLGLKNSYSDNKVAHTTVLYLDLMTQALPEYAQQAAFMHIEPADSPEQNAKGLMRAFTKEEFDFGWKLLNKRAEEVPKTKFYTDELKDAVWAHTLHTINDVLKQ